MVAVLNEVPESALQLLEEVEELLKCAADLTVAKEDIAATVRQADRLINRLKAIRLQSVMAATDARVETVCGANSTGAWLARVSHQDGARAARDARLAADLSSLVSTRNAFVNGEISQEHAAVVAHATHELQDHFNDVQVGEVEAFLVKAALSSTPGKLRRLARRAISSLAIPDPVVGEHEARVLEDEEQKAYDKSSFSMHDNGDGTSSGRFVLPNCAAAILRKVLQQMVAPRRQTAGSGMQAQAPGQSHGGQAAARGCSFRSSTREDFVSGHDAEDLSDTSTWTESVARDHKAEAADWQRLMGQALVTLLEKLPTEHLSGKTAATIVVTVPWETLVTGTGAARTDTGQDLSPGEVRRLACGAGIAPVVLGGDSHPIDVGRTRRFFTEHQRLALATLYEECATDRCDRPLAWSEIHHENAWAQGGSTNLSDAVPLCGFHHRLIHSRSYHHRLTRNPGEAKTVTFRRRP